MSFTALEKVRIRKHLGYPNASEVTIFTVGGLAAPIETAFVLESAMNRVLPEAEGVVRRDLDILDELELQVFEDTSNMAATKVGSIEINRDEMDDVMKRYVYWRADVGNVLGVDPNPFDKRFGGGLSGGGGINVRVR